MNRMACVARVVLRLAARLTSLYRADCPPPRPIPNPAQLVPALVEHGSEDLLSRCHFMPGVPVKPMLAKVGFGCEACGGLQCRVVGALCGGLMAA